MSPSHVMVNHHFVLSHSCPLPCQTSFCPLHHLDLLVLQQILLWGYWIPQFEWVGKVFIYIIFSLSCNTLRLSSEWNYFVSYRCNLTPFLVFLSFSPPNRWPLTPRSSNPGGGYANNLSYLSSLIFYAISPFKNLRGHKVNFNAFNKTHKYHPFI